MTRVSRIPTLVSVLGACLTGVLLGEGIALVVLPGEQLDVLYGVSGLTTAPFLLASLYGGFWLSRSELPAERYRRIGLWGLGGLVGFVLLNVATMLLMLPMNVFFVVGWMRWAGTLGSGTGVIIGIVEARAIQRAVRAERERVRAQEAETREELLAYLHDLLRHKVRNAVNAIQGNAALLANHDDPDDDFRAAIDRQTEELLWITRETRTLLEASESDKHVEPVELGPVVRAELDELEAEFDDVDVEFRCPDGVTVLGDDQLHRVFRNLVGHALLRDADDVSRILVAVDEADDAVRVRVEDDGPAIPDHEQAALFDLNRGGTPELGLGLPLVRILVERYGGALELAASDAEGSVFLVELPRSTDGSGAADRTPAPLRVDPGTTARRRSTSE